MTPAGLFLPGKRNLPGLLRQKARAGGSMASYWFTKKVKRTQNDFRLSWVPALLSEVRKMRRIYALLALVLLAALPAAASPAPTQSFAVAPSLLSLGASSGTLSVSLLGTDVGLTFENVSGLN